MKKSNTSEIKKSRKNIIIRFILILLVLGILTGCTQSWEKQYNLGIKYLEEGNYQEAIIAFTEAIEIDDKQPLPYVGRGDAYILLDESFEEAQADYEKALELDDTISGAYLGLAEICIRQDRLDDAITILEKGLKKTGDDEGLKSKLEETEEEKNNSLIEVLKDMPYYGDVSKCKMTEEQALAYAQLISDGLAGKFKGFYGYGGPVKDEYIHWDKPYTIDGYSGEYDTDRAEVTLADLAGDGNPFLILKSSLVDDCSFEIYGWNQKKVSQVFGAEAYLGRAYSYISVNEKTKKGKIIGGGSFSAMEHGYEEYLFNDGKIEFNYSIEEQFDYDSEVLTYHFIGKGVDKVFNEEEFEKYMDGIRDDGYTEVMPDIHCSLREMVGFLNKYAYIKDNSSTPVSVNN